VFGNLSDRLVETFKNLRTKGKLSPADIDTTLREIRRALLEADVALEVVKSFVAAVRERALSDEVSKALNPAQQVVQIVNDELVQILGGEQVGSNSGLLTDHIRRTRENYSKASKQAGDIAKQCLTAHDGAIEGNRKAQEKFAEENRKMMSELGEKRNKFCSAYSLAMDNPRAGCSGNMADTLAGARAAFSLPGAPLDDSALRDFARYCAENVPQAGGNSSDNTPTEDIAEICYTAQQGTATGKLAEVKTFCTTRKTALDRCTNRSSGSDNNQGSSGACPGVANIESDIRGLYRGHMRATPESSANAARLETQPAYCNAGSNDNRENVAKGFTSFADALANGMGAGSQ
jgi:hypothetical protein